MNERFQEILDVVERLASGEKGLRIPISEKRDHLDALAFGVNAIAQELLFLKEEADAANLAKTRFLATMSHEIRTPLSAVLGLCEMLRDPLISDSDRFDTIQRIRTNGDFLLSIVDEVLDLTKIEAGKTELSPRPMNPSELLGGVIRNLEQKAKSKSLSLQYVVGMGVPRVIQADPLRVKQILTNLIANSIKFTAAGHVRVELQRVGEDLEYRVSDTGMGIAPEKQKYLFEAYQQADQTVCREFGGTGLGLALGRRLALLMNGSIFLESSAPGKGSTFVFRLPAQVPVSKEEIPVAVAVSEAGSRLKGVKVLLAEDSPELRFLYRNFLEKEGAEVSVAADGVEALECANATAFDLMLMDVNMPRLGGIEATRRLRKDGFSAPIVALTAHALGIHEAECKEAGYTGSLSKPFYPDTLTETVRRALGRA